MRRYRFADQIRTILERSGAIPLYIHYWGYNWSNHDDVWAPHIVPQFPRCRSLLATIQGNIVSPSLKLLPPSLVNLRELVLLLQYWYGSPINMSQLSSARPSLETLAIRGPDFGAITSISFDLLTCTCITRLVLSGINTEYVWSSLHSFGAIEILDWDFFGVPDDWITRRTDPPPLHLGYLHTLRLHGEGWQVFFRICSTPNLRRLRLGGLRRGPDGWKRASMASVLETEMLGALTQLELDWTMNWLDAPTLSAILSRLPHLLTFAFRGWSQNCILVLDMLMRPGGCPPSVPVWCPKLQHIVFDHRRLEISTLRQLRETIRSKPATFRSLRICLTTPREEIEQTLSHDFEAAFIRCRGEWSVPLIDEMEDSEKWYTCS
jgi:hypothetical protein